MTPSRRDFLALATAGFFGGCAAAIQPMGPPIDRPRWSSDTLVMPDGVRLPCREWRPPDGVARVGTIVALHGFNDYSNAFDAPARVFAARGLGTIAFDQRGFGAAPAPGIWAGTETMASDAAVAVALARDAYPDTPVHLLGESMGGAVALAMLANAPGSAPGTALGPALGPDSVILVAPALWGFASMGLVPRVALQVAYATMPGVVLHPPRELRIRASDNIEMLRAMSRDPLVIKGARVDALHGLTELMGAGFDAIHRLSVPTLVLYGANEQVLSEASVAAASQRFSVHPMVRRALYPHGFHMLLRDLHAAEVIDDIINWISDKRAPLPSGADMIISAKTRMANETNALDY